MEVLPPDSAVHVHFDLQGPMHSSVALHRPDAVLIIWEQQAPLNFELYCVQSRLTHWYVIIYFVTLH